MKTVEDDLKEFQKKENERLDAEREYIESISDERKLKNIASFMIVGTFSYCFSFRINYHTRRMWF